MIFLRAKQRAAFVAAVLVLAIAALFGNYASHGGASVYAADPLCGTTITTNLTLTADLDCTGLVGTVLIAGLDGITINGQGHKIFAPDSSTVIAMGGRTGVTVKNIGLSGGSSFGIQISGGGGNLLSLVDVSWEGTTRSGTGIHLVGGSGSTLERVTGNNRVYGFRIQGNSDNNEIKLNTSTGSTYGLVMDGDSDRTTVDTNNFSGNTYNVWAWDNSGRNNSYTNNNLSEAAEWSLGIGNDPFFVVAGNNFTNSNNGIALQKMTGISLTNAHVDLTSIQTGSGVHLSQVTNSTITGITTSAGTGITVLAGGGTTISNIDVSGNGSGAGIYLNASSGDIFENITANDRTYGFRIQGNSDNNEFSLNTSTGSTYGLVMDGDSDSTTIDTNNFSGNTYNVWAWDNSGQNNSYTNNNLSEAAEWSLTIGNDPFFVVAGNNFTNSNNGIALQKMTGISLTNAHVDLTSIQTGSGVHLSQVTNSTITGITTSAGTGMRVNGGGNNTISDLWLTWPGVTPTGTGIYLSGSSNNTIQNVTAVNRQYGVQLLANSDGNTIQGNKLSNAVQAIEALPALGNKFLNNDLSSASAWSLIVRGDNQLQVRGNDFTNSLNGMALVGIDGINLSHDATGTGNTLDLSQVKSISLHLGTVTNSTFTGIPANAHTGIQMVTGSNGNTISGGDVSWKGTAPRTGTGIHVVQSSNNTFENVTGTNRAFGIRIFANSNGNSLQCSSIANNASGIDIGLGSAGSVVNHNQIVGNLPYGLLNNSAAVVNAEDNYWGSPNGPGSPGGDAVLGLVDADPFATDPRELDAPCGRNLPPLANTGPDQTVIVGKSVQLDGNGSSDPDEGDPLNFTWTLTPPAGSSTTLANADTATTNFTPDVPGQYVARLVVDDGIADSEPDQVIVTAITVAAAVQTIKSNLQTTVDDNLGTPLADKLEDGVSKLQNAVDELDKAPPDNQTALGSIEGAVGDIDAAVNSDPLYSAPGSQQMDQLAEIARCVAAIALSEAITAGGDADVISDSQQALAKGDALRLSGAYKGAVNKYKDALAKAESTY